MGQNYIGERFGDYKLVRPLGEGGFATVYLGEEVHKGTYAAVKLSKEQQVHDFINELRRTVLLRHPNIIPILDFGIRKPDDTAFIIMEYAPNGSFRDKFPRDTRVPLDVVVPAVKQVASALQYAHDQRVIHRDVKPENLLLNARNMILLSDFGIATASRTTMTANAGPGDIIGTYAYMAPEQLKGRPVPASDQYSLAIMVYEWLCGELPFEGREYIQWHYLHEKEPPPALREHIPSLSPAVEQVVLRALAKKPEGRFERVEVFALALEQAAQGGDVSSVMSTPQPAIQATQFDASVQFQAPSNSIEQLFQEGVRSQTSGDVEEAFRIWRQVMTLPGVPERYSTTARNRIRELRTPLIPLRLKQAREASLQGRWQEEIRLWEDLLALEPSTQELTSLLASPLTLGKPTSNITQSLQARLQIARQNEQSTWMYEGAQKYLRTGDSAAATTQLKMLWQDAPYYGDPAGLSKALGVSTPLNYEQAIAAEQTRLQQERLEQQRLEQARLLKERHEQERILQERLDRERLAREKQEQERLALEEVEQSKAEKKRLEDKRLNRVMGITSVVGGIVGVAGGIVGGGIIGGGSIGGFIGGVTGGRIIGGILGAIIGVIVEFVAGIFIEACGDLFPGEAAVGGGAGLTIGLTVGGALWLLIGGTVGHIAGVVVGVIVALIVRSMVRRVS